MQKNVRSTELLPVRQAGVGLHPTSLPGPYGIGEIGHAARAFIDSMQKMQLGVWQFLPLGPTAFGDSPYQPLSTFAGNEMLIDIGDLLEIGLLKPDEVAGLTRLADDFVDFGGLIGTKTALLRTAAGRFAAQADQRLKSGFDQFQERNNTAWLHDYSLYRILKSRHNHKAWPQWQPEFAARETAAIKKLQQSAAVEVEYIKIMQYLFHDQWQRLREYANASGIQLFGDMPIYIALDSSDAWANREILKIDKDGYPEEVGGVPPDYFSADGQLWGNPLYDWEAHKSDGYQWWIRRLRASMEVADIVRIDHFRGFEAYWSIPAEATTAKHGTWEQGPGDAIFDSMKKALGSLPIVAEDLGVITPEVEALRDRHQLPGMVVLQFSVTNSNFDLAAVAENRVCYTGTHDNDTTLGWFQGGPGDKRSPRELKADQEAVLRICGGTADNIAFDLIKAAFSTPARLAMAPMQDYLGLGSEARTNTPGTASGNWRWRLNPAALTSSLCDEIATAVSESNRTIANERH